MPELTRILCYIKLYVINIKELIIIANLQHFVAFHLNKFIDLSWEITTNYLFITKMLYIYIYIFLARLIKL